MKDNYPEMNVDMEQILINKEYDELTSAEKEEIKDFISSKEDFYLMKNTLVSVKNSFGIEEEIVPNDSAKESLMKMFEQQHNKVVSINRPRPFYMNPVFQIGVAALFILGIIYFYPETGTTEQTAMNEIEEEKESANESPAEKNNVAEEESVSSSAEETESDKLADVTDELEENSDSKPAIIADFFPAETSEEISLSESGTVTSKNEVAKGEGFFKSTSASDSISYSDVNRALPSSKKEKAKADDSEADFGIFDRTSSTTTVATGGIAKTESPAKDEEKKDGRVEHTNTAGGHYGLPAHSEDLKKGVSLKDKPALTEFLFTAL